MLVNFIDSAVNFLDDGVRFVGNTGVASLRVVTIPGVNVANLPSLTANEHEWLLASASRATPRERRTNRFDPTLPAVT